MSTTIPPLVCDTPPPIDEFEDFSGDEDISVRANGSNFEDETSSPSYHHHYAHNSIFATDSFTVVEDISSELNDVESIEQTIDVVSIENPFPPPSDTAIEMIGQKKLDTIESSQMSQNRTSFAPLDVIDTSTDCDDNVSNQTVCLNSQSFQSERTDDSDFDEQRLWIETNEITAEDGGENLDKILIESDKYKSTNNSLNGRIIHSDELSACEMELSEALTRTIGSVQCNKLECDEKTLNEMFDADFSRFASIQKNIPVLSTSDQIKNVQKNVQNFEIGTTSGNAEGVTHVFSTENTDNEDDEFGDFSSFSPPTTAASSSPDTTAINHVSVNNSSSSGNSSSQHDTMNKCKGPHTLSKQKTSELENVNDSDNIFDSSSVTITNPEINADEIKWHQSNCIKTEYNLDEILSTLFPLNMTNINPEDDFIKYVKCSSTNDQFQFMNELTINLMNVENANALKHQWAKSAAKTFLVKSLGIDPRNILYGKKWNSSAPKFAANLGLSPLEPMKLNITTSSDTSDNKSALKIAADVPAAQFDWNSSGLINPLDGSRKSATEERDEISLESPEHLDNESLKAQEPAISAASEMPKIISTISAPIIPEIESSQLNKSNEPKAVLHSNPNQNIESVQTSDSYNVPGSSGTMKETHIFTPIKSQTETHVELSTNSSTVNNKLSLEDTERVVVIRENVVKKEYRDIEYDPERVISSDEFSDFQFVNTTSTIAKEQVALEGGQKPSIGFETNTAINDKSESNSAIVHTLSHCNGFEKSFDLNMLHSLQINQSTQVHKMNELKKENYDQIEHLKPFDESMQTDISVCPSADKTRQTNTEKSNIKSNAPTIMLSNILKPQLVPSIKSNAETSIKSPPNIEWPEPGIDTDQLMRLEQRFYTQSQVNETAERKVDGDNTSKNSSEKYSIDDEWSEFVSVEQPQTPITNILSKNLLKQQNDEDDWSEFVSSTVPMNTKRSTLNVQAPNYDIHSTNDSINSFRNCNERSISVAAKKPNSMYGVSMNQITGYSEAPSMISTLPDLRFVAPKSLVHMPSSSLIKK